MVLIINKALFEIYNANNITNGKCDLSPCFNPNQASGFRLIPQTHIEILYRQCNILYISSH